MYRVYTCVYVRVYVYVRRVYVCLCESCIRVCVYMSCIGVCLCVSCVCVYVYVCIVCVRVYVYVCRVCIVCGRVYVYVCRVWTCVVCTCVCMLSGVMDGRSEGVGNSGRRDT